MLLADATSTVVVVEGGANALSAALTALAAALVPFLLAAMTAWVRALREKKSLSAQLDAVVAAIEQAPPEEAKEVKKRVSGVMTAAGFEPKFHERVKKVTSSKVLAYKPEKETDHEA